jgi:superfamily II DNA helicase RecQ
MKVVELKQYPQAHTSAPPSAYVLPHTVDPKDTGALQQMLGSDTATFRSLHQYQVYHTLQVPGHVILNVAATGSGKTLPYQLLMYTASSPATSVMIVPYNVLHGEMLRCHEGLGLSVARYDRNQPFPSNKKIVLVSLETLGQGNKLYDEVSQLAASGKLKCIAIDEARM